VGTVTLPIEKHDVGFSYVLRDGTRTGPGTRDACIQLVGALGGTLQAWHQGVFAREAAFDPLKKTIAEANQFAPGTFPEALRVELEPVASGETKLLGLTAQVARPDGTLDVVVRFRRASDAPPTRAEGAGMFGIRGR